MTGTFLNVGTVLVGTALGALLGARLPDRIRETVLRVLGLFTLLLGLHAGLRAFGDPLDAVAGRFAVLIVLGSAVIGGILGELLRIEQGLDRVGEALRRRFARSEARFTEGFVVASLVFCVGPLTVLGSIRDGLTGDFELLAIKSLLDGVAAMAFAATLGWGVGFAAITVLVVQGGLALGSRAVGGVFTPAVLDALTAVGGILILGIGFRLLDAVTVRVANLLPALVLAPASVWIVERFT